MRVNGIPRIDEINGIHGMFSVRLFRQRQLISEPLLDHHLAQLTIPVLFCPSVCLSVCHKPLMGPLWVNKPCN